MQHTGTMCKAKTVLSSCCCAHMFLQVEFFEQGSTRINPGVHIPPEATAVHGLTKDMLTGCPSFATLAQTIYDFADGCDLAGYNVRRLMVPMLT